MDVVAPSRFSIRRFSTDSKYNEMIIQKLVMSKHTCHKRKMKYHLAYSALYMLFAMAITYILTFHSVKCPICEPCKQVAIHKNEMNKFLKPDYALKSTGGKIVRVLTTTAYVDLKHSHNWILNIYNKLTLNQEEKASKILEPDVNPGNCWAFNGDKGAVIVKLFDRIYISGVTLQHTPMEISPTLEISSAPKKFTLTGLNDEGDLQGFQFGGFEYDLNGRPAQYFDVDRYSSSAFQYVKLNFTSNWGKKEYTCVYRIQIHGKLEESIY